MTDLDRAEQAVERAANFHKLVFEYAKEQAKAQHLHAPDFEWRMFALGLQDNCDELFAGLQVSRDDLRENLDEIQRGREDDFNLDVKKEAV